jgi:hypothetical protein
MRARLPCKLFSIAILSGLCFAPLQNAPAQTSSRSSPQSLFDLSQIVNNLVKSNAERAQALRSDRSQRTYTLVFKGFSSELQASMVADLAYRSPGTKTFTIVSTQGSKMLVNRVLKRLLKEEESAERPINKKRIRLDLENYRFSDLHYEPAANGCSYSVSVEPIVPSKYVYRGRIWINDPDFAVCRIEVHPAKGPSFWIKQTEISETYAKHGKFWLPERNTSISQIRFGGHATLTIDYGNYTALTEIANAR